MLNTSAPSTNDFAAINQGQLKWLVTQAKNEMDAKLPGGAGAAIDTLVAGFSPTNYNYLPVNIGQLKAVTKLFYDRLSAAGMTNAYPWTTNTTTDDRDFAMANLGQLKYAFDFTIPTNTPPTFASISGTITYSGPQTGAIWVIAVTASNSWATNCSARLSNPGAYALTNLPALSSYWIKAWRDSDGDATFDATEANGSISNAPLYLATNIANANILLADVATSAFLIVASKYDSPSWLGTNLFNFGSSVTCDVSSPTVTLGTTQYVCIGWTGTGSVPPTGTNTSVQFTFSQPSSLTWRWTTNHFLTTSVSPSGYGSVSNNLGWYRLGATATVTAVQTTNSLFRNWTGTGISLAGVSNNNPLTFVVTKPVFLTANFDTSGPLTVQTAYGTPSPASTTLNYGSKITASVSSNVIVGTTQYVSKGWTGTGSVSASGSSNAVSFTFTQPSTINWSKWATNYFLSTAVSGSGSVTPAGGWYAHGTNVSLTATANSNWNFVRWTGDTNGCLATFNNLTMTHTRPRAITAVFATNSAPTFAAISGTVSYTGPQTGAIWVVAVTASNSWATNYSARLSNPGAYAITNLPTLANYWIKAWRDNNDNGSCDNNEVFGIYSGSPVLLTTNRSNINIALQDVDTDADGLPDWWELNYFGNLAQTAAGDLDGEGLKNGEEYQYGCDPTDADTDDDGLSDYKDVYSTQTIFAWGDNSDGQCNVPALASNVVAVSAGGFYYPKSVALRRDGSVVVWGASGVSVPWASNVVAVSVGGYSSSQILALLRDGRVMSFWDDDGYDYYGVPAAYASNAVAVSVGGYHSLALRRDGSVVAWGRNNNGQCNVPTLASNNVMAVSAGGYHSLALRRDGSVVAWGYNDKGQTNVPVACVSNAVAISAGAKHSLALLRNGSVVAWGYFGIFGEYQVPAACASNMVAVSAGGQYYEYPQSMALRCDGSVVAWGALGKSVPWASNVVAVSVGCGHSLALAGTSPTKADTDGDGLLDGEEVNIYHTNPLVADSDKDGMPDKWEVTYNFSPTNAVDASLDADGDGLTNLKEYQKGTDPHYWDTDRDGYSDLAEVYPLDPLKTELWTATLSGTVSYAGRQTGTIYVVAVTASNSWATNRSTYLTGPGQYAIANVPTPTNYWIKAWRDSDGDLSNDTWEATGIFSVLPVYLYTNLTISPLTLTDPDSDGDGYSDAEEMAAGSDPYNPLVVGTYPATISGTVAYAGFQSGPIYVVAVTASNSWAINRSTYLTGPGQYAITNLPALTNYWIKAWRDSDGDLSNDMWEATGILSTLPVYLATNRSTPPLTLTDPDSDGDGLPNWWERGAVPPSADTNNNYYFGTNPNSVDTDGDGLADGYDGLVATNRYVLLFPGHAWVDQNSDGFVDGELDAGHTSVLTDTDGDGMPDWWEAKYMFSPANSADAILDADHDGLANLREYQLGTNPRNSDTDGDSMSDLYELTNQYLFVWGDTYYPLPVLSNVVAIASGTYQDTVLFANGTIRLWRWGCELYDGDLTGGIPTNVVAISGGSDHVMALLGNGEVWCFDPDYNYYYGEVVPGLSNVVAVSAGNYGFSLALLSNKTVTSWGDGADLVPANLTNIVAVAAGYRCGIALTADGFVRGWGAVSTVPPDLSNVVAIAAADQYCLALQSDGRVTSWGPSAPPDPTPRLSSVKKIAAGADTYYHYYAAHSMALLSNGTVVCWGDNECGQCNVPPGLTNVTAIDASVWRSLAVGSYALNPLLADTDGDGIPDNLELAYGLNPCDPVDGAQDLDGDQIPNGWEVLHGLDMNSASDAAQDLDSDGLSNLLEYQIGTDLRSPDSDRDGLVDGYDGVVATNLYAQLFPGSFWFDLNTNGFVDGEKDAVTLPVMLDTDGDGLADSAEVNPYVVTWTNSIRAALITNLIGAVNIAAGWNHVVVLLSNGTVRAFGTNNVGQCNVPNALMRASNTIQAVEVAAGGVFGLARLSNGQICAWGEHTATDFLSPPVAAYGATRLACGYTHALALRPNKSVIAWGDDQGTGCVSGPNGVTNVLAFACGRASSIVLLANGGVKSWGVGSATIQVTNAVAVAAGLEHMAVLLANGRVVSWGVGSSIQTNVFMTNAVAVSCGRKHTAALLANGRVVAWGDNAYGQCNIPADVTNAVRLVAMQDSTMVLTADGRLRCWGRSKDGPLRSVEYGSFVALEDGTSVAVVRKLSDPIDVDTDNDNLSDLEEWQYGTNPYLSDTDGDGLSDYLETKAYFSNPLLVDTDGDGLTDGYEVNVIGSKCLNPDSDADGLQDAQEVASGTNPNKSDTDGDGLNDLEELTFGTSQTLADTDGDGLCDGVEVKPCVVTWTNATDVTIMTSMIGATDLEFGLHHVVALVDGRVVAFGWGPAATNVPPEVANPTGGVWVVEVVSSDIRCLARLSDGRIFGWGGYDAKWSNIPPSANGAIRLACGLNIAMALMPDGHVVGWGDNTYGALTGLPSITNAVDIACEDYRGIVLLADGRVVSGLASYPYPTEVTNAVSIACGRGFSAALLADGRVKTWNGTAAANVSTYSFASSAVSLSCNDYHSAVVLANGRVVAWGDNGYGECNVPEDLTNAVKVATTYHNTLALTADGQLRCWGEITNCALRADYGSFATIWTKKMGVAMVRKPSDPTKADTDGDGLSDFAEWGLGADAWGLDVNGDGLSDIKGFNPYQVDTDADGLRDIDELRIYGTNPHRADSDGDGMPDKWEVTYSFSSTNAEDASLDADSDGLTNLQEYQYGTNPRNWDTDGDGVSDFDELLVYSINPFSVDTENDGLLDGHDGIVSTNQYALLFPGRPWTDANHNGFVDGEMDYGTSSFLTDSDGDGLSDVQEVAAGYNPAKADTDNDGMTDGWEVRYGLNPLVNDATGDLDGDGFSNLAEFMAGTNPNNAADHPENRNFTVYTPLE